jgi:3',5'-cyclic AMP phosphodiesterase CpdA
VSVTAAYRSPRPAEFRQRIDPAPAPWTARVRRACLAALLAAAVLAGLGVPAPGDAAPPDPAHSLRVVVVSDLNESYGSVRYSEHVERAIARVIDLRPALVISTGDMVAGQRLQPPLQRGEVEAMWSAFHQAVTDPLARAGLPLAVTPGNHDASSGARFALEREIYRRQWQSRRPRVEFVDAGGYPFSYAFSVGRVLFVSLDATFVGPLSERERGWLDAVLQVHGARFTHRVVFSHVPLWPVAIGRERDFLGDERLESVLRARGVDLYLSGHHHAYYPGTKDGVRYVSQACLGAAPRPLIGTAVPHERAITVLEIPAEGPISVEAYRAPDYMEKIHRHDLPERIVSRAATLIRDDLAQAAPAGQPR